MKESDGKKERYSVTVTGDYDGKRMDSTVVALLEGRITRSRLSETLLSARRNGEPVKLSVKVHRGDVLEMECLLPPPFEGVLPEAIPLEILHEDKHLLIINKPFGMPVHPSHGHPGGTLVNALLHRYGALPGPPVRPGIIHRLDKDTSGLIVCAKSEQALSSMAALFKERQVEKEYTAIVRGNPSPSSGLIDHPIGRHPRHRKKQAVVPGGKPALTEYRTLGRTEEASLLGIRLHTGRTHQIRVHLGHIGCPILGDSVYARHKAGFDRLCLAATRISFTHPLTGEQIRAEIPLPAHMLAALEKLGIQSP